MKSRNRPYEVWYDDIEGEHYLSVVKAGSTADAIDKVYSRYSHLPISKAQLKAFDMGYDYMGLEE